jgi:hypothetical protein
MTEDEIVQILSVYFGSLFPKVCTNCNHSFATLREYIQITERIGPPISFDAEMGKWDTTQPIGSMALSN